MAPRTIGIVGFLGGECGGCPDGHDNIDLLLNEVCGQFLQARDISFGISPFYA